MKLVPRTIQIAGKKIKISFDADDANWGEYSYDDYNIKLRKEICTNQNLSKLGTTIFHEVVHCILGVSGLNEIMDERQEEGIVRALENHLYPLLPIFVDIEAKVKQSLKRK